METTTEELRADGNKFRNDLLQKQGNYPYLADRSKVLNEILCAQNNNKKVRFIKRHSHKNNDIKNGAYIDRYERTYLRLKAKLDARNQLKN